MTIDQQQQEIIEEFSFFEDWMEKYEHIIELGKELEPLAEEHHIEDNLVKGCQSRVWLHADQKDNHVVFAADSDAVITKGLVALMMRVLNDQPAEEVAKSDLYFIDQIGLKEHLSPTRSNGLVSMVKKMKLYAVAYMAKSA
ncbi:MAG: SufE family protein [Salibacteraceae bacterium]